MLELMPVILIAIYVGFLTLERLFPARPLPAVPRWTAKGIVFFFLSFLIGGALPELWTPFFVEHALFDLSGLGLVGGFVLALVLTELFNYVWHRATHRVHWLWRWTHQMHHSAERVDVLGAFYFHPLDNLVYAVMSSALGAMLGVSAEAAALTGIVIFAMACFQHANLRTPRWIGWVVQRPEAHAIHHERGVHAFNYGNLALFDQLFGTYRNAATYGDQRAGFWDGASSRIVPMLLGRDVGSPERPELPARIEAAPAE